ncbi:hypothetical protein RB595_001760 [Gaeumannomyces hyphopodioides]
MAQLAIAKQQLRQMMKSRLAAVSRDSAMTQSQAIFNSLLTWPPYVNAKRLSVFLSMPSGEVQTDAIVRHALRSGKDVFVPYLHKSPLDTPATPAAPARVMDMVRLRDLSDYESLAPDRWGIPSIDPATVHERERILSGPDAQHSDRQSGLDLILMPGVAFDVDPDSRLIRRCGHGKGFYDFFLHRYDAKVSAETQSGSSTAILCGLSLTEQFLTPTLGASIPTGPMDRCLDALIVGNGDIKDALKAPEK